ncbi:ABC transporter substrate-binding protein [Paenibacillus sp. GCM10012303]|uniref:ABC transporter substrate-binding protein n=1 Tax=Paenibacillus sp. GCM10012303 TaxID=3317340 RepID=UPI00360BFAD5
MIRGMRSAAAAGCLATVMLVSACGGSASGNTAGQTETPEGITNVPEKPKENITLKMLQDGATISDEEFANLIAAPVKAKFPHITVEMVRLGKGEASIESMLARGDFPDFMFTTYPRIKAHRDLGTALDLSALIQTHKLDMNRFDAAALETSRVYGDGKYYGIPFSLNFLAFFYNKDLFDQFGVSYPKEGMTWEETIAVARSFSRTVGGVTFKGIMLPGITDLSTQLTLPRVDLKTNKAMIASDGWRRVFDVIKAANEIPGNQNQVLDDFLVNQTLAMLPSYDARFAALEKLHGTPNNFNWDITQFPSFKEYPNRSLASSGHFLLVSASTKKKDEAFEVIKLLTSNEIQNLITEHGRFTSLRDEATRNRYGVNMKSMQGKNISVVFKSAFAPPFTPTPYDSIASKYLNEAVKKMNAGQSDINTIMREAEELTNRDIEAELKK